MQTYITTSDITHPEASQFLSWFYRKIGTESELNEIDNNRYSITFLELEPEEVEMIREYENKHFPI